MSHLQKTFCTAAVAILFTFTGFLFARPFFAKSKPLALPQGPERVGD